MSRHSKHHGSLKKRERELDRAHRRDNEARQARERKQRRLSERLREAQIL